MSPPSLRRNGACLAACAIALFLLFLNRLTPLMADDYCMMIGGISEIPGKAHSLYQTWTGRIPAHALIMLLADTNKLPFDILNTLVLTGVIGLALFMVGHIRNGPAWILLFALLWVGTPAFGEAFLWVSGSANYLWTLLLILIFLWPYFAMARGHDCFANRSRVLLYGWMALAFLSGWTNENVAPVTFLMALGLVAYTKHHLRRDPPAWWKAVFFQAGGIALLLLAPGNTVRLHGGGFENYLARPFWDHVIHFAKRFHKFWLFLPWPVWIFGLASFALTVLWVPNWKKTRETHFALLLVIAHLLATGALFFSPYVEKRALTGGVFMLALAAVLMWLQVAARQPWVATALLGVLILGAGTSMGMASLAHIRASTITAQQQQELEACRQTPCDLCILPGYEGRADAHYILPAFAGDNADETSWGMVCRARIAGVGAIRLVSPISRPQPGNPPARCRRSG